MAIVIQMPKLGHTMSEGKVVQWHKREGDAVREGESILTIETDKTEVEVESPGAGVLSRHIAGEGEVVAVGGALAVIAQAGESVEAALTGISAGASQGTMAAGGGTDGAAGVSSPAARSASRRVLASPRARRLAAEQGIELSAILGHGADGAVTEDDVRATMVAGTSSGAAAGAAPRGAAPAPAQTPSHREKLTRIQSVGARNLVASWQNVPHFTQMVRVDMSRTLDTRRRANENGAHFSVTDFILAATVAALMDNPRVNSSFADGELIIYESVNLGLAVDTPDGLVVPVIHGADSMDISQVSVRVGELAEKARAKKLAVGELEGATFTVSNLGAYGIENGTPVIFAPQAGLMFVGAIHDEVLAIDGHAEVRPAMQIAIAYDHRALDGAMAARFTTKVKQILEAGDFATIVRRGTNIPAAEPDTVRPREVEVESLGDSLRTRARHGALSWEFSAEHPQTAPDPITGFLASLASCLLMSLRVAARGRKLNVGRASAIARCNEKGHVTAIDVELKIETAESDDKLDRLIEVAERGCHIRALVRDDVPVRLSVSRI
jgi:pyruvate dehydrogenase E2 component (dihydrolipoamide acetyltransferase)